MIEGNHYNTTAPMPTLRQEQVQLTQQRILDTFESELAQHGYVNVSVRAVAKSAGISVPTVYRYYANKEAMLTALLDAAEAEQGFNPFAVLASTHDPLEALTRLLDGLWAVAERRPGRVIASVQALVPSEDDTESTGEG